MPRGPRTLADGETYHLTARGNDRQDIFRDDGDRSRFIVRLAQVAVRHGLSWTAYCLMGNHVHLLASGASDAVSAGMRDLLGGHARWFNRRHGRTGHLFGERYHHVHVESDAQFAAALRYVALNPVRAGLVERPDEWPWSSYAATAGGSIYPGSVDLAELARRLPGADPSPAGIHRALGRLVEPAIGDAKTWAALSY